VAKTSRLWVGLKDLRNIGKQHGLLFSCESNPTD